jgi:hypothetical protein
MADQMDWTEDKADEAGSRPRRGRKSASARPRGAMGSTEGEAATPPATAETAATASPPPREEGDDAAESPVGESDADPLTFTDVEHLTRKGLRILPVVTGAVVDAAGNFLFYLDGHDDARSGVQAQLNHLLRSGPSRAEHLGPARARARYLANELARSR